MIACLAVTAFLAAPEMLSVEANVQVEKGLDAKALARMTREVRTQIATWFGTPETPRVVYCASAACKISYGADPRAAGSPDLGFAYTTLDEPAVVVTAMNDHTRRVLVHELVHAVMKTWAPYDATPVWFNEGTATAMADEPACGPAYASFDVTPLVTKEAWQAHIAEHSVRETYCQSRYAVEAWAGFVAKEDLAKAVREYVKGSAHTRSFVR